MNEKTLLRRKGKSYSIGEEIFSSVSHGIATLLSIAALVILTVFAVKTGEGIYLFCALTYTITLIMLFLCSTLYHAITNSKAKKVLQVLDHCAIFLLIAGTYTPFTLLALNSTFGTIIFSLIWSFAVLGIVLNAINIKKFKILSMILYVAMGWCVVVVFKPLVASITNVSVALLLIGGLCYTVGIIFYSLKKKLYFHSIWHIFVLAGAVLHFFSVLSIFLNI